MKKMSLTWNVNLIEDCLSSLSSEKLALNVKLFP